MRDLSQWYTVPGLLKLVENSRYRETEQPAGLTIQLRPYQQQTLAWMIDHESQVGGINACFWERRKVLDERNETLHEYFYCPLAGELLDKEPPVMGGGFVCEEMGLGKTVEALALVLARPAPRDDSVRATLIVVPQSLLEQWQTEIEQRVEPGALRTFVFNSTELAQHKSLSPDLFGYTDTDPATAKAQAKEKEKASRASAKRPQAGMSAPTAARVVGGQRRSSSVVQSLRKRATSDRVEITGSPSKVAHTAAPPPFQESGKEHSSVVQAKLTLPTGFFCDGAEDASAFTVTVPAEAKRSKKRKGAPAPPAPGAAAARGGMSAAERKARVEAASMPPELRPGTFVVASPAGVPLFSGPGRASKVWPADGEGRLSPAVVQFLPCGRLASHAHAELVDLVRVSGTVWGRLVSPPTYDKGRQLLTVGLGTCAGNALRPVAWVPIQHPGAAPRMRRLPPVVTWYHVPFAASALAAYDIVLTTYEELSSGSKASRQTTATAKMARMLHNVTWYRVILDESQRLKNSRNVVSQAATDLKRVNSWLLSGTPADNAVHDLVGQLVFLGVEPWCRMGKNLHNFWDGEIKARWLERDPEILDTLQTLLSHIMMRHSKTQVGTRNWGSGR
jgi:hypothetical protein